MATSTLLIEKANSSIDWIHQSLKEKGYAVSLACDKKKAVQQITSGTPDLIILNATSSLDGPKICRTLHETIKEIPIILIVAEGETDNDPMGATVILVSPFTSRKLFNRIRMILKSEEGESLQVGRLTLSLGTRCVSRGSRKRRLTPKEFALLRVFMRNPGRVLSRKFLMKKVWETDYIGDTRTLDVHIHWLRTKIEENPSSPILLRTVRGVGYRFDMPEAADEETERET